MKHALTIGVVTIAMLFLIVPTSRATSWCSKGPDEKPDHLCDDDTDAANSAAAKFGAQWQSISGVNRVYAVRSDPGEYMELEVIVDPPSLASSVEAVLPTEAGGFPVKVVAQPNGYSSNDDQSGCASDPQTSSDGDTTSNRLDEALADSETRSWLNLPGVLLIGAVLGGCGTPPKIAVYAQLAMMDSVKAELPSHAFGFEVEIVALQ